MNKGNSKKISPSTNLIGAFFVHGFVEIPYFIFPVVLILVEKDLSPTLGEFTWIGLGSVGTISALASGLPAPIFGWLADRYRRGIMMTISLLLASLGALLLGLFGKNFLILLLGITLTGLANSLYHPPGLSFVSEAFIDPDTQKYSPKYNRVLGIHGVGGTLGASSGPISVFLFIELFSFSWQQIYLFWSPILIVIAFLFLVSVARRESEVRHLEQSGQINPTFPIGRDKAGVFRTNYSIYIIYAFMFAMSLTWGMISFVLAPILTEQKDFSVSVAALFVGTTHMIAASGQLVGGVLGDRYSEKVTLSFTALLQLAILVGIYFIDIYFILFLLYTLLRITNSVFWPLTNSLLAKSSTYRGKAFGWFMLIVNVVRATGPFVDGLLISSISNAYLWIFVFSSLFSILAFLLIHFANDTKKSDPIQY
ncbi:MAG: MFS transporter [Promethearchaeota archaeon]